MQLAQANQLNLIGRNKLIMENIIFKKTFERDSDVIISSQLVLSERRQINFTNLLKKGEHMFGFIAAYLHNYH